MLPIHNSLQSGFQHGFISSFQELSQQQQAELHRQYLAGLPAAVADPSGMQQHPVADTNELTQLDAPNAQAPASDLSAAAGQGHLGHPPSPKTAAAQAAILTAATACISKDNIRFHDVQPSTAASSRPRPPPLQQLLGASPRSPQTASKLAGMKFLVTPRGLTAVPSTSGGPSLPPGTSFSGGSSISLPGDRPPSTTPRSGGSGPSNKQIMGGTWTFKAPGTSAGQRTDPTDPSATAGQPCDPEPTTGDLMDLDVLAPARLASQDFKFSPTALPVDPITAMQLSPTEDPLLLAEATAAASILPGTTAAAAAPAAGKASEPRGFGLPSDDDREEAVARSSRRSWLVPNNYTNPDTDPNHAAFAAVGSPNTIEAAAVQAAYAAAAAEAAAAEAGAAASLQPSSCNPAAEQDPGDAVCVVSVKEQASKPHQPLAQPPAASAGMPAAQFPPAAAAAATADAVAPGIPPMLQANLLQAYSDHSQKQQQQQQEQQQGVKQEDAPALQQPAPPAQQQPTRRRKREKLDPAEFLALLVSGKLGAFPSLANQVQQLTDLQQGTSQYHSIGQDALQQQQQGSRRSQQQIDPLLTAASPFLGRSSSRALGLLATPTEDVARGFGDPLGQGSGRPSLDLSSPPSELCPSLGARARASPGAGLALEPPTADGVFQQLSSSSGVFKAADLAVMNAAMNASVGGATGRAPYVYGTDGMRGPSLPGFPTVSSTDDVSPFMQQQAGYWPNNVYTAFRSAPVAAAAAAMSDAFADAVGHVHHQQRRQHVKAQVAGARGAHVPSLCTNIAVPAGARDTGMFSPLSAAAAASRSELQLPGPPKQLQLDHLQDAAASGLVAGARKGRGRKRASYPDADTATAGGWGRQAETEGAAVAAAAAATAAPTSGTVVGSKAGKGRKYSHADVSTPAAAAAAAASILHNTAAADAADGTGSADGDRPSSTAAGASRRKKGGRQQSTAQHSSHPSHQDQAGSLNPASTSTQNPTNTSSLALHTGFGVHANISAEAEARCKDTTQHRAAGAAAAAAAMDGSDAAAEDDAHQQLPQDADKSLEQGTAAQGADAAAAEATAGATAAPADLFDQQQQQAGVYGDDLGILPAAGGTAAAAQEPARPLKRSAAELDAPADSQAASVCGTADALTGDMQAAAAAPGYAAAAGGGGGGDGGVHTVRDRVGPKAAGRAAKQRKLNRGVAAAPAAAAAGVPGVVTPADAGAGQQGPHLAAAEDAGCVGSAAAGSLGDTHATHDASQQWQSQPAAAAAAAGWETQMVDHPPKRRGGRRPKAAAAAAAAGEFELTMPMSPSTAAAGAAQPWRRAGRQAAAAAAAAIAQAAAADEDPYADEDDTYEPPAELHHHHVTLHHAAAAGQDLPAAASKAATAAATAAVAHGVCAAAAEYAHKQEAAFGHESLPNIQYRASRGHRWQVYLSAQTLKYLYVGLYNSLAEAVHVRDVAILAVHGYDTVIAHTLVPTDNYTQAEVVATRMQMSHKPAARAVMVANGLWPLKNKAAALAADLEARTAPAAAGGTAAAAAAGAQSDRGANGAEDGLGAAAAAAAAAGAAGLGCDGGLGTSLSSYVDADGAAAAPKRGGRRPKNMPASTTAPAAAAAAAEGPKPAGPRRGKKGRDRTAAARLARSAGPGVGPAGTAAAAAAGVGLPGGSGMELGAAGMLDVLALAAEAMEAEHNATAAAHEQATNTAAAEEAAAAATEAMDVDHDTAAAALAQGADTAAAAAAAGTEAMEAEDIAGAAALQQRTNTAAAAAGTDAMDVDYGAAAAALEQAINTAAAAAATTAAAAAAAHDSEATHDGTADALAQAHNTTASAATAAAAIKAELQAFAAEVKSPDTTATAAAEAGATAAAAGAAATPAAATATGDAVHGGSSGGPAAAGSMPMTSPFALVAPVAPAEHLPAVVQDLAPRRVSLTPLPSPAAARGAAAADATMTDEAAAPAAATAGAGQTRVPTASKPGLGPANAGVKKLRQRDAATAAAAAALKANGGMQGVLAAARKATVAAAAAALRGFSRAPMQPGVSDLSGPTGSAAAAAVAGKDSAGASALLAAAAAADGQSIGNPSGKPPKAVRGSHGPAIAKAAAGKGKQKGHARRKSAPPSTAAAAGGTARAQPTTKRPRSAGGAGATGTAAAAAADVAAADGNEPAAAAGAEQGAGSKTAAAAGGADKKAAAAAGTAAGAGAVLDAATGIPGIRLRNTKYEAFLCEAPFRYLYLGQYTTMAAALAAKAAAQQALYGPRGQSQPGPGPAKGFKRGMAQAAAAAAANEAAMEGVVVSQAEVKAFAVRLVATKQGDLVRSVMEEHGTLGLLKK